MRGRRLACILLLSLAKCLKKLESTPLANDQEDCEGAPLHYEGGIPILPGPANRENAARHREEEQRRKDKEQHTSLERGMLKTQIALAFFFCLGAVIGTWQANTAQQAADISEKSIMMAQKNEREARLMSERQFLQSAQIAERSIKAAQEQVRLDQRAWVGFSDLSTKYSARSQVAGSVIINTGKSPARNIEAVLVFSAISNTGELNASVERWIRKVVSVARKKPFGRNEYLTNDPQEAGDRGGIKFSYNPDLVSQDITGGVLHAPMTISIGTLAPNEEYPLAGIGQPSVSHSEWNAEFMQTHMIVVFRYIRYTDIFDQRRTTTFCNERLADQVDMFGRCPFYNDMK